MTPRHAVNQYKKIKPENAEEFIASANYGASIVFYGTVRNNNEKQIPEIDILTNRSHAKYIYNLIVDGSQYLDF